MEVTNLFILRNLIKIIQIFWTSLKLITIYEVLLQEFLIVIFGIIIWPS